MKEKYTARISTNRKYMINNIFLPVVRIGNIYYNEYFLTVVSRNIICFDTYGMICFMSNIKGWSNISSLANNGRQATLNIAKLLL